MNTPQIKVERAQTTISDDGDLIQLSVEAKNNRDEPRALVAQPLRTLTATMLIDGESDECFAVEVILDRGGGGDGLRTYDIAYDPAPENADPHGWTLWGMPLRAEDPTEVAELFRLELRRAAAVRGGGGLTGWSCRDAGDARPLRRGARDPHRISGGAGGARRRSPAREHHCL
jgi:hypothetical protein